MIVLKKVNFATALTGSIIALFALLAACGPSSPETEEPSDSSITEVGDGLPPDTGQDDVPLVPPDIEMEIADFAFSQPNLTVPAGTKVIWYNSDSAPHTVTTVDRLFDSGRLSRDGTFSYTFEQPGVYDYYCAIHPYMTATVIVE